MAKKRRPGDVSLDLFTKTDDKPKKDVAAVFASETNASNAINASDARNARIELSGERKNLSTYLDTALFPHVDMVRAQLQIKGITAKLPSKTELIELSLLAVLEEFYENGEDSVLAHYIRDN